MAHYDLKALQCELCSKSFVSKNGLKHHTQSKHLNEQFFCDECGKFFSYRSGLLKHKMVRFLFTDSVVHFLIFLLLGTQFRSRCTTKIRRKCKLIRHLEGHERRKELNIN